MTSTSQAVIWMVGAIVSFTAMAVAGRTVSFQLDTFEIMLFRSLVGVTIMISYGVASGAIRSLTTQRLPLHALRNLFHFTGQNLWFYALPLIPMAQVFALEFTTPLWVVVLTPLVIGDRMSKIGVLSAALGFIGILIVTRPTFASLNIGVQAAALSAVAFAITALFTKKLSQDQSIFSILFYLTVMQAVFGLICAGFDGDITLPSSGNIAWVILIGCAGLFAHLCLTNALTLAPAATVMPIDFARLPVIAVIGAVFYQEPIDIYVICGAIIIVGANYLNLSKS